MRWREFDPDAVSAQITRQASLDSDLTVCGRARQSVARFCRVDAAGAGDDRTEELDRICQNLTNLNPCANL